MSNKWPHSKVDQGHPSLQPGAKNHTNPCLIDEEGVLTCLTEAEGSTRPNHSRTQYSHVHFFWRKEKSNTLTGVGSSTVQGWV